MIPRIRSAFNGWESDITLIKITQTITDYQNVETESPISFKGVVQPLEADKLKIKSEGQRNWEWWQIHTRTVLDLKNADLIKYNGLKYKVMDIKPYNANGYYEYHIVENYRDE